MAMAKNYFPTSYRNTRLAKSLTLIVNASLKPQRLWMCYCQTIESERISASQGVKKHGNFKHRVELN